MRDSSVRESHRPGRDEPVGDANVRQRRYPGQDRKFTVLNSSPITCRSPHEVG
jgi:hypothetical protein